MTSQAHAFGWFLFGMAVGSGGKKVVNKTTTLSGGNIRYLDVYNGSCWTSDRGHKSAKSKSMLNSGLIKSFDEPTEGSGDKKRCTDVYTHAGTYHINKSYNEVVKKLFKEQ